MPGVQSIFDWWPHPSDEKLVAFRDGELPAPQAQRVSRHVISCKRCRGILELQRSVERELFTAIPAVPPDEFDQLLALGRARLSHALSLTAAADCDARFMEEGAILFGEGLLLRQRRVPAEPAPRSAESVRMLCAALLGQKVCV